MAKMQQKQEYLNAWQQSDTAQKLTEIVYSDFEQRKQPQPLTALLGQVAAAKDVYAKSELTGFVLDFVKKQTYQNENLKTALVCIVENCFDFIVVSKIGKTIWQNSLIILSGVYRSDYKIISAVINLKTPKYEKPHQKVIATAEQTTTATVQAVVVTNDAGECDSCPETLTDIAIGKGDAKRQFKQQRRK